MGCILDAYDEWFDEEVKQRRRCRLHPSYKAIRPPRCNCQTCWEVWEKKNI